MTVPITLEQAQTHLAAWMQADLSLTQSKEYEIDGRKLKREDAEEVRANIKFWADLCQKLQPNARTGLIVQRAVIRDL
jgi:hypothetical protein